MDKQIIYYTCNTHQKYIDDICREQLLKSGIPIISVSLNQPLDFGDIRIVATGEYGAPMMHRQVLMGLGAATAPTVFLCESDVLYPPSHFEFTNPNNTTFFYDVNVWKYHLDDDKFTWTDDLQQVSATCVDRELATNFYRRRNKEIAERGFDKHFEAGPKTGEIASSWLSPEPSICIRHPNTISKTKKSVEDFNNKRYAKGWKEGPCP